MGIWLSLRSRTSDFHYDAGLYYFQTIQWNNTFPLVPGLGNLHHRLAFNQTMFPFVAALNLYPLSDRGLSIANGFLFLLTMALLGSALRPVLRSPSLRASDVAPMLAITLAPAIFLVYLVLDWSHAICSATPDFTVALLQCVLLVLLTQEVVKGEYGQISRPLRGLVLLTLSATAVTLKLSSFAFSLSTVLVYLGHRLFRSKEDNSRLRTLGIPALLLLFCWMVRGYVLSGVPLFPLSLGRIDFAWALSADRLGTIQDIILGWSRQPGDNWQDSLNGWQWVEGWFHERLASNIFVFLLPLGLSAALSALTVCLRIRMAKTRLQQQPWSDFALLLPGLLSLIVWFYKGPDPRFAVGVLWTLCFAAAFLLLKTVALVPQPKLRWLSSSLVLLFIVGPLGYAISRQTGQMTNLQFEYSSPPQAQTTLEKARDGLTVRVPQTGDQAWNTTIPTTPSYDFNPQLRLRQPPRLQSGFVVERQGGKGRE